MLMARHLLYSNHGMPILSRQLLIEPVAMRYGVGLAFVRIEGEVIIARDCTGLLYRYDTRYDEGIDIPAMLEGLPATVVELFVSIWFAKSKGHLLFTIHEVIDYADETIH
jgi:hypothetical protein